MCGIFGYVGKNNNAPAITFEGLKTLEYRGYDSWGIATRIYPNNSSHEFLVEKDIGKIKDKSSVNIIGTKSNLSIGHTRWATHGGVIKANAHPHLDCTKTIAVIHNGIIENFEELKDELRQKGHKFISETDTEVVPHLIEENLKKMGFSSAVREAFNRLKGFNAIVVSYATSSQIIAAKNGSPLVIGVGEKELLISSDASGILPYTKKIVFLKDNQMAILGDNLQIISLPKGEKVRYKIETIDRKIKAENKGKFADFMLKEIYEQPRIVKNIAENSKSNIDALIKSINSSEGVFFIGAGTAYYACLAGQYLFSKVAKKHVNAAFASEFNYLVDFLNAKSLIIALSQSGETIDVVESLSKAKKKQSKIFAITNSFGSTIYRMADYNLLLEAGTEKAVASTKAYIAKLCILVLTVLRLTEDKDGKTVLLKTASEIERLLSKSYVGKIKDLAKKIQTIDKIFTIGRGISYASALEASLKIKEVSYINSEGFAGGELKHGPIALISQGTPCIVFAPNDETFDAIISNAIEIKSRGATIIGISFKNNNVFDYFFEVKDIGLGSYIAQIVVAQLLAYFLAKNRKLDPDKPRNLAKSVTVK